MRRASNDRKIQKMLNNKPEKGKGEISKKNEDWGGEKQIKKKLGWACSRTRNVVVRPKKHTKKHQKRKKKKKHQQQTHQKKKKKNTTTKNNKKKNPA